ncbi:MAG: argonaute/piwi family protein, partial [bacterium]
GKILARLRQLRAPLSTATGKLARIRQTLTGLKNKHKIVLGSNVRVTLGDLLVPGDAEFPVKISTSRPSFLCGPQGRKTCSWPDRGIQRWGPFKYMQHTQNTPLIGVVCEASHRGRVEQFINSLRDGFPDESWKKATSWRKTKKPNPFEGGLVGKFRLTRVSLKYEEVERPTAQEYRRAAERLLNAVPAGLDLAIVQTRERFKDLRGDENPYLVSKAAFMEAGVPVQAVCIENVEADDSSLPYILNNIALANYAKLDGIPWVISTRGPTSHELVFGLGYSEIGQGRLGAKARYVGITTVFQGDGRYLVWGLTREVEFDNYAEALLKNLHTTIRYVRDQNRWQEGDDVRLIFHVYKPLKNREVEAIKRLVENLVEDQLSVEYAFLNLSSWHMYQIFDPQQGGVSYTTLTGRRRKKGKGVPERGLCYQLSKHAALLHLTGPHDLKTAEQGTPRPLLVKLHPDSDFTDLTYLVRQIYHFTFMSWRSFFPATEPVTILYSRLIARMLGSLNPVTGWNSKVLSVGSLRDRRWFL